MSLKDYQFRSSDGRWKRGQTGNPGGKVSLRKDLERAHALDPSLPTTPAEARAKWWAMVLPIAFAGPRRPNDRNWAYAAQEVGTRLLGKPKETVAIEHTDLTPVDWSAVPEEEREEILVAITKLQAYVGEPESDAEH